MTRTINEVGAAAEADPKARPEITVVIPTYNRLDTLREVIPSLLAQELGTRPYEIVVADSNSNDGTREYLDSVARNDPRMRHLPGAYSGRAAARNAGIAAARGQLVLFTDADIIAAPDLLARHLARHRDDPSAAVVGMELQVASYAEYERLRDDPTKRRPLHPPKRKHLSWLYFLTGNASVHKRDLMRVGCFDESFTGYGHEDLELGYRLQHAGLRLVYEPRAVDFHWHPVPYQEQKSKMTLAGRSTVRFYRKHPRFGVRARLGMTPLSLGLHALLRQAPALVQALERRAARGPGVARELVLQYHYVNGIKEALRQRG
ncbi:MAG: glycosyltransferase family 2 protein [Candidatus Eremiobacteraeota bacterium]|nr:glycosyltransferase family 2 protein [Candidatus Eremiobacteraeota bacterium]